jgi:Plasmid encoded RepA protein
MERESHGTTLRVESGRDRQGNAVGLPYGSIARLILLYLQTEATLTNCPEGELERSMKLWMSRMSLSTGGKTYLLVTEQARRISACRLTFFTDRKNGAEGGHNGAFVQDAISLTGVSYDNQPTLWQDRVGLDARFWQSLQDHPVSVREEAIQTIGSRSLAIDVYIWLAYRLHSLTRPIPITWTAVHAQFGAILHVALQIKPIFTEALNLALAVYPEAGVRVERRHRPTPLTPASAQGRSPTAKDYLMFGGWESTDVLTRSETRQQCPVVTPGKAIAIVKHCVSGDTHPNT